MITAILLHYPSPTNCTFQSHSGGFCQCQILNFYLHLSVCVCVLTKYNKGAKSENEDEEQQHTHSHCFPSGWSRPVHLSWQTQSDPQRVVTRSNQLLQPSGHPHLRLLSFNSSGHVHCAVVWMTGSVGIFIGFSDQHLVVSQWRKVFGSAGVGGLTSILVGLAGGGTGLFFALGQDTFLPFAVLFFREEIDKAVDVALRLVPKQEDAQTHLQGSKNNLIQKSRLWEIKCQVS